MPQTSARQARRKPAKNLLDVLALYSILREHFGFLDWWPGETTDEILIGAILTQNTNWQNVEKALEQLRQRNLLDLQKILAVPLDELAPLIRSSGYYNQKAKKLHALAEFLKVSCNFGYNTLRTAELGPLREGLLKVKGIGPETADSILNYGLDHPIFVVDAYTRRIAHRLGYTSEKEEYSSLQTLFQSRIGKDLELLKDFHAQLVYLGHHFCRPKPLCKPCPLVNYCPEAARQRMETAP